MSSPGPFESPLRLEVRREERAHVVWLCGAASMDQVVSLHTRLVGLIEPEAAHLILDLSGLDFISSMGIGAIVAAHIRARSQGGSVHLANPTKAINKLFRLVQIDRWIPMHDTLEAARAAVGRSAS